MTAVVFVGPTLAPDAVRECLDATLLPPVRQGDVYRAARDGPQAIGIIDGYFEGVPSVWHKEILWAIEQGIAVFGSASMGALRAAELADFGMIGIGQIFEDYRDGTLMDDDEVAVLHGPAGLGFLPLSEPMVSVRATIGRALSDGVLPSTTADAVLHLAKSIHYRDRKWDDIIAAAEGMPGVEELAAWVEGGKVDAKARDARDMLRRMSEHLAQKPPAPAAVARTERTLMWKRLRASIDAQDTADSSILDEVRLSPQLFARLRSRAALSVLAREHAQRQDNQPDRATLVQQMNIHRSSAGLTRREDLQRWLGENDMTPEGYEAMLADAASVESTISDRSDDLDAPMLAELRRDGLYAKLRDRARRKSQLGITETGQNGAGRLHLVVWFFETRLDQPVPDDLESFAIGLGLTGRDAFIDLIEAEYLFCQTDAGSGQIDPKGADLT